MNELILNYLKFVEAKHNNSFLNTKNVHKTYKELYDYYLRFDYKAFKERTLSSLIDNLNSQWLPHIFDEKQYAIIFEYDNLWEYGDINAFAYGVNSWLTPAISTVPFSMENHEISDKFYCLPSFSLDIFKPFQMLDSEEHQNFLGSKLDFDLPGYEDLVEIYKTKVYLELFETLNIFSKMNEFKKIKRHDNFLFTIEQHDTGTTTPLLIIK